MAIGTCSPPPVPFTTMTNTKVLKSIDRFDSVIVLISLKIMETSLNDFQPQSTHQMEIKVLPHIFVMRTK